MMSEHFHPGPHLDADQLSAFMEGVLPEHERAASLAHMAECAQCRRVAFLAQETTPEVVAVKPEPAWKGWFGIVPMFSVALAGALIVATTLYFAHPKKSPVAVEVSTNYVQQPVLVPLPPIPPVPAAPAPKPSRSRMAEPSVVETAPVAGAGMGYGVYPPHGAVTPAPQQAMRFQSFNQSVSDEALATRMPQQKAVPSGYADANAPSAPMAVPPPPPPVAQPQMSSAAGAVERQLPGSVSETVEVSAANAGMQTEAVTVASNVTQEMHLPSKLPAVMTASAGDRTLALDTKGTLFASKNGGRRWKKVKPQWQGMVSQLMTVPAPYSMTQQMDKAKVAASLIASAHFQLTTMDGVVWVSEDGIHWRVQ